MLIVCIWFYFEFDSSNLHSSHSLPCCFAHNFTCWMTALYVLSPPILPDLSMCNFSFHAVDKSSSSLGWCWNNFVIDQLRANEVTVEEEDETNG
jgi:hypothetical protein